MSQNGSLISITLSAISSSDLSGSRRVIPLLLLPTLSLSRYALRVTRCTVYASLKTPPQACCHYILYKKTNLKPTLPRNPISMFVHRAKTNCEHVVS